MLDFKKNKTISVAVFSFFIVLFGLSIFIYSETKEMLFKLNLEKNKEQAERIATLVSIDLERGIPHDQVLKKFQVMLEITPQSKEHFACIVEDENKVIAHPKPSNIGKDVTGWKLKNEVEEKTFTQSAGEGIPFGGIQTRLDGSQDISYQIPISTKPWAVCVHTKLDLIKSHAYTITVNLMFIIAIALIAMFVALYLIFRYADVFQKNR